MSDDNALVVSVGSGEKPAAPTIRLRDVALLLFASPLIGASFGLILSTPIRFLVKSHYIPNVVLGASVYSSWLFGYHWIASKRGWPSLRTRFAALRINVLLAGAGSALLLIALVLGAAVVLQRAGFEIREPPTIPYLPHGLAQLPLATALLVIIGPAVEELLFRGVLLDWLKQKLNVWAAALILSLVFSLLHNNGFKLGAIGILAFVDRFLLGLLTSAFAIRYRSLLASFVMHATLNGVVCIASVLVER
jgi:membrane protease YdiL (CAAX protease family)